LIGATATKTMDLSPFHILGMSLPTLLMLYAMATPALGGARVHREVFGDGSMEFEARFDTNPDGILKRGNPAGVPFAGHWRDHERRIELHGVRYMQHGRPAYHFSGMGGVGEGELRKTKRGCSPDLHFHWHGLGGADREGVLSSGPCYGS
jgi:hypothetical protein